MGGTQAMIDSGKQYEVLSKNFKHVGCYIFFSRMSGSTIDYAALYKNLVSDVSKELEKYGITSYEFYEAGGGGGGFETFWDIIKELWENRDLISFFWSMVRFLKILHIRYEINSTKKFYTEALVSFKIESDGELDKLSKRDLEDTVSSTLANLLIVTNAILDDLRSKYKAISFDLSVEARLPFFDFSSAFVLKQKYRNSRDKQMLRYINSLKVKKGICTLHEFKPLYLIKRTDRTNNSEGNLKFKEYYMLLSTSILSDLFK